MRRVAGGYVQVTCAQYIDPEHELAFFRRVGKAIESGLRKVADDHVWEINLQLSPVVLELDCPLECRSIWIWFYAKASTLDRAIVSRERLLESLKEIMCDSASACGEKEASLLR